MPGNWRHACAAGAATFSSPPTRPSGARWRHAISAKPAATSPACCRRAIACRRRKFFTPVGRRRGAAQFWGEIHRDHAAGMVHARYPLGYRYEGSPICIPDGTPAPPDEPATYVPTARPGHRAPHAWLAPGQSTLDLRHGFVLLRFGAVPVDASALAEAAAARGVPLHVQDIRDEAIAAVYERRLVLVRPDGHVAWRGDALPDDADAVIDRVRGGRGIGTETRFRRQPRGSTHRRWNPPRPRQAPDRRLHR